MSSKNGEYVREIDNLDEKVSRVKETILKYKDTDVEDILDNQIWMRAVTQIEDKDEYLVARYLAEKELAKNNT